MSMIPRAALAAPGDGVVFNSSQIQDPRSSMCGRYCIIWLRELAKGRPVAEALDVFDPWPSYDNEKQAAAVTSE